ncbi:MAG: ThuA domain-containing protein [Cyclobacteriaceae bacterium]
MLKPFFFLLFYLATVVSFAQQKQWVEYTGVSGPGKGKHIVFVSGDEEYRSEEALPMLAQILSRKYGFNCTVLFSIDPKTGAIDAMNRSNIPGLQKLETADLMVIFTRFRELPDEQMKYIDNYLKAGKPVIGIRTATHAFNYRENPKSPYAKYDFRSTVKGWKNGFGRKVLGETWVAHHGHHGVEGTRALIDGIQQNAKNPILNGVKDIWCKTDVYTVTKLPEGAEVLLYGQCTSGMTPEAPINLDKSIMPVAWAMTYEMEPGKKGKVLTSTIGASIDLVNEDLRRFFVNACFWGAGLKDKIPAKADVSYITEYKPTMFSTDLFTQGTFPSKYELK